MDNMCPACANTGDCAAYTPMTWVMCMYLFVQFVFMNIKLQLHFTVPVKNLKKNKRNTCCLTIDGQHAPCTHKHCRLCSIHAHGTEVCVNT